MQKILVPLDGSETALRAADHAVALAKRLGAELHFLTVYPEPVVYGEIQVYATKEKFEHLQREMGEGILEPALKRARASGLNPTSDLRHGDVAPTIIACAQETKCDSIVMGTRGMGAIANLLLGSVALKVVHLADTPVTLVK
jgi:nucleotide-binding universal stress UspA family protein